MGTIHHRRGFTLIELLVVISIILVILAIAIPHMDKQMQIARELAVIREIGSIQVAETQYNAQFGNYATALTQLGPPVSGADNHDAANLIPKALADGKKNGYVYSIKPTDGYVLTAVPETPKSNARNFYSDQTLTIRNDWNPQ